MSKTTITSVKACEVYGDRGKPALQVEVETASGTRGKAQCVAGLSVGGHEAPCLYDGGRRFDGYGVQKAAETIVRRIGTALVGMDASNQAVCDATILGFSKEEVGANSCAAVSAALLHAASVAIEVPLYAHLGGVRAFTMPIPGVSAMSGSTRYGGPSSIGYKPSYAFVAYDFETFSRAACALWEVLMDWIAYVRKHLNVKITQPIAGMALPTGKLHDDRQLWEMMADSIAKSGYQDRVGLQIDMAANCFYNRKTGLYEGIFSNEPKSREDMITAVIDLANNYPFVVVEDPLHDEDFDGYARITRAVDIQVTADDLVCSDPARLAKAVALGAGNAVRVSTGQIGTITEMVKIATQAYEAGFGLVVSGGRGEGLQVSDYAVGLNAGTVGENGITYTGNRLLQIEAEIGPRARFFGKSGLRGKRFSKCVAAVAG